MEGVMCENLVTALEQADIVVAVVDVSQSLAQRETDFLRRALCGKPGLAVLNKIDLPAAAWRMNADGLAAALGVLVMSLSSRSGEGIPALLMHLQGLAPVHPHVYPEDDLCVNPMREIAAGMILEEVLSALHQEIPYQTGVVVEDYREEGPEVTIAAALIVNQASQKGMVIGKGGVKIKTIGSKARLRLEQFLGRKVRLTLFVKVDPNWIKDARKIKDYL
jgi:GTP-binding protein Era